MDMDDYRRLVLQDRNIKPKKVDSNVNVGTELGGGVSVGSKANLELVKRLLNSGDGGGSAMDINLGYDNDFFNGSMGRNLGTGRTTVDGQGIPIKGIKVYGGGVIDDGNVKGNAGAVIGSKDRNIVLEGDIDDEQGNSGGATVNIDNYYGRIKDGQGKRQYGAGYRNKKGGMDLTVEQKQNVINAILGGDYQMDNGAKLYGKAIVNPMHRDKDRFEAGMNWNF